MGIRGRNQGMSLVEVMITMGVASVLMLGVLQIVNMTMRANRGVTINADWSNMLALVRMTLGDDQACGRLFVRNDGTSQYTFDPDDGSFAPPFFGVGGTGLVFQNNGAGTTSPLLDIGQNAYPTFRVTGINVTEIAPGSPPSEITRPDPLAGNVLKKYWVYSLRMSLAGDKKNAAGDNVSLGGNALGTTVPIPFRIVVGPVKQNLVTATVEPNPYPIVDCYANASLADACAALGGVYTDPPAAGETPCVIDRIQFFGHKDPNNPPVDTPAGNPGETPMVGEKIQLWGDYGTPAPDDYAIGYRTNTMWFNLGGTRINYTDHANYTGNFNEFLWYQYSTVPSTTGFLGNHLMALDAASNLVLNPADDFDSSRIAFGAPNTGSGPLTEYIQSNRRQPAGGPITGPYAEHGLDFYTNNRHRFSIRNDGEVRFGWGRLILGGLDMDFGGGNVDTDVRTRIVSERNPSNAAYGGIRFDVHDSVANQQWNGALTLNQTGHASFSRNLAVGGNLTVNGTGGNVPHNCAEVAPVSGAGVVQVSCAGSKKAYMGGCASAGSAMRWNHFSLNRSGWTCRTVDDTGVQAYAVCCDE